MGWPVVDRTSVEHLGKCYRLIREEESLTVVESDIARLAVGRYAQRGDKGLIVNLTPGSETYYEARACHGDAFSDCDLVAGVVAAAICGHPDADRDRARTELSAVWSHHLAIVGGEDPRWVAKTYAPRNEDDLGCIQNMAVTGVRVRGCEPEE